jgi:hypothetical protein
LLLLATLVAPVLPGWPGSRAHADEVPAAMSWWGYWVGRKGDTQPGSRFLRRRQAASYGSNVVLVHAGRDPGELEMLRAGFDGVHSRRQDVGVILMIDNVLRKQRTGIPGDISDWYYGAADYEGWHTRLAELSSELHRPGDDGWRPVDVIVAIAGFDEVNVYSSLAYQPAGGAPNPIPYAMELAEQYFPEVPERGHVWKIGPNPVISPPPNAFTLGGSTLPFAYHYASFLGPFTPTTVPFCPREGTYPAGDLPDLSFAQLDATRLREFVDAVNTVRGTTDTPVVFIPYSNRPGNRPTPESSRGTACTLETLWYHVRCLAAQSEPWATQVRGFVAWQWDQEPDLVDPVSGEIISQGWTGTQRNRTLKRAGRWIGHNRRDLPCTPTR